MYRRSLLENGIRVVTQTVPGVRSVSIGALLDAGPRNERNGDNGLAHLTEHCLFQGTRNRTATQIARLIDAAGGRMGAFTARDYTCCTATVLDDYATYALDLLGDLLTDAALPEKKVESEKRAILHEIDREKDIPHQRVHALLKSRIWPEHPLGRPVAGSAQSVSRLDRSHVKRFMEQCYGSDRLILTAAGNLDHDRFHAQVTDAFWAMKPVCGASGSACEPGPAPRFRSGVEAVDAPLSQSYFAIGVRFPAYAHEARYGLHLLTRLIGGGLSSRLYRRMREERGLVYEIGAEYHAYADDGVLVVEGGTSPEDLVSAIALALVEIGRLFTGDDPPEAEELWIAKMQIRGEHILGGEQTDTLMSRLATQEHYFRRPVPADEILSFIDGIEAEDLERLTRNTLSKALGGIGAAVIGPGASASAPKIEAILKDLS